MFNTFSMMLLKFKCITVLAFLILEYYVLSLSSGLLNIERGDRDVFDNLNCDSHTNPGCSCKGLYAECVEGTNCTRCRCSDTYATFLSSDGKNGECVTNRHLLFIPASSNSFSVENIESKQCIVQKWNNTLRTHFITKTTCQSDEKKFPYQRWIWTRYNQLMHVKALRCLQPCRSKCSKMVRSGKYYWRLQLGTCNSTKTNQLWQCTKENSFRLETSELYMYLDSSEDYIYASNSSKGINWKRFSTNKKLCSRAFGCYDFVHSVILVTDINCDQTEKEIAVPPKDGENSCSVMWEKLQYLDNKIWKDLNFRDKIFTIVRRSKRTFLQLNFLKATNNWTGLIVKLQFSCAVNAADSKCIVVKFRENAVCPTAIHFTVSTAIVTDVKLITNYPTTSTTDAMPNTTTDVPKKHKSDSSNVMIIAVCVVIAILILCGILGFIFCKRRRLSEQSDNAAIKPGHVHAEPEVTFRTSSVSDDCGYEIPCIKKTVSPGQAGTLTAEPQHKKRWNNRDVEDKEVIDDSDYVIPAVRNTKSPDHPGGLTAQPQHKKRWNNRDVEDNVVIDDPGYEVPNRPDMKTTLSPDEADALYAQPEGEKEDDGGYVKPDDMEDGLGNLIPADEMKTTLGKDKDSSTLKGETRDSDENGHYQSLKAEERYEHVYQGLLPTTNR